MIRHITSRTPAAAARHHLLRTLTSRAEGTVLRQVCTPFLVGDVSLVSTHQLARQLLATMARAEGVGLAAPQIGIAKRIFVAQLDEGYEHEEEDAQTATNATRIVDGLSRTLKKQFGFRSPPKPSIIINPVIHRYSSRMRDGFEGCLSLPGLVGQLTRPIAIDVTYVDENGELVNRTLTDFRARIFQHEFDHLEGKLFIDRLESIANIWTVNHEKTGGNTR